MKEKISKILAAAAAIALLAGPALASEATNDTTGADSTNNASIIFSNDTGVENNNNAWVDNNIQLNSNTGGNSASMNTGDGTIDTGSAGIELGLENQFNMNETNIDCDLCDHGSNTVRNSNTGYNSENNASIDEENETEVENNNDLHIRNRINGSANTGDNEADKNTGDGSITTGDATIRVNVKNKGNENITNIGEEGGQGGGGGPGGGGQGGGGQGGGIGGAVEQIAQALGIGGAGPVTLPKAGASLLGLSLLSSMIGFVIWKWRKRKLA